MTNTKGTPQRDRTPAEHRAAVAAIDAALDAPAPVRLHRSNSPRHKTLADLSALLAMRSRPVGVAEEGHGDVADVGTNWRLTPANDNQRPEGSAIEMAFEITPTLPAIEGTVKRIPATHRQEPAMLAKEGNEARRAGREVHSTPHGENVEYGVHVDEKGKGHKTIVGIGKLRFSDGEQRERGYKLVMAKPVAAAIRMPVGAMLGGREKAAREKGSAPDPVETARSNSYFGGKATKKQPAGLFQAKKPGRVKRKDWPKERVSMSKAEARQMLADAIANTPVMPAVKHCPLGFPAGPRNLAQLFPGLVKVATGESGSEEWSGIHSERAAAEEFARTLQGMKDKDVELLTQAVSANSLQEIGEARGYSGKYAIAAGRRLLVAANDNFEEAKKIASAR